MNLFQEEREGSQITESGEHMNTKKDSFSARRRKGGKERMPRQIWLWMRGALRECLRNTRISW